jgi:hypothetical protein
LGKLGTLENYNIIHIVISDGADNNSSREDKDFLNFIVATGYLIKIPVKTILIGVDLD